VARDKEVTPAVQDEILFYGVETHLLTFLENVSTFFLDYLDDILSIIFFQL
jgi:hypothetical protein